MTTVDLFTCSRCQERKGRSEFYVDRKSKTGRSYECKDCRKKRAKENYAADPEGHKARHKAWVEKNRHRVKLHKIKSAFGLSPEEYEAMPQVCVICGSTEKLCVDHSHRSGRVRGILCQSCNKGLGHFRDDPTLMFRAAEYILGIATPEVFRDRNPDIFRATYEAVEYGEDDS